VGERRRLFRLFTVLLSIAAVHILVAFDLSDAPDPHLALSAPSPPVPLYEVTFPQNADWKIALFPDNSSVIARSDSNRQAWVVEAYDRTGQLRASRQSDGVSAVAAGADGSTYWVTGSGILYIADFRLTVRAEIYVGQSSQLIGRDHGQVDVLSVGTVRRFNSSGSLVARINLSAWAMEATHDGGLVVFSNGVFTLLDSQLRIRTQYSIYWNGGYYGLGRTGALATLSIPCGPAFPHAFFFLHTSEGTRDLSFDNGSGCNIHYVDILDTGHVIVSDNPETREAITQTLLNPDGSVRWSTPLTRLDHSLPLGAYNDSVVSSSTIAATCPNGEDGCFRMALKRRNVDGVDSPPALLSPPEINQYGGAFSWAWSGGVIEGTNGFAVPLRPFIRSFVSGPSRVAVLSTDRPSALDVCPDGTPRAGELRRFGDVNCDGAVRMAVLGDSYISGEGLTQPAVDYFGASVGGYEPQTDSVNNNCHRSKVSWAVLAADAAGVHHSDLLFAACSGARATHIKETPQYEGSPEGVYGGRAQRLELADFATEGAVDLVIVSIGGNDARFSDQITACLFSTVECHPEREQSLYGNDLDNEVRSNVRGALRSIQEAAPGAKVLHVGYPNPIPSADQTCPEVPFLSPAEKARLSEYLSKLNHTLAEASADVGATFLDLSGIFEGLGLCSASGYLNGLAFGNEVYDWVRALNPLKNLRARVIANESFHPTDEGHAYLFRQVMPILASLLPIPNPDPRSDKHPTSLPRRFSVLC
jgi:lysophospholipase L1-like esterase